jgi:hypothetical protein
MINQKDAEIVKGIYRLRRLLVPAAVAAESTFEICASIGVTKEEVFEITAAEDQRRTALLAERARIEKELAE